MLRASKLRCSYLLLALALPIFAVGCGSNNSSSSSGTRIRFVNASPDQLTVNVLIDGTSVATALANGGGATAYLTVKAGARRIQVQDPATATNLIDTTPTISAGTTTTFILQGFIQPTNTPLILTDDNSAPTSGSFKVRALNLAPNLNSGADVYVETGTTTSLSGLAPTLSGLPYPASTASGYVTNTAGSWAVFFTAAGDQSQIWGGTPTTFAAGQVDTAILVEVPNGSAFDYRVVLLTDVK